MTDPLGQSQVLPYLEGLSKGGHRISLLSAEKQENFEKHKQTISEIAKRAGIDWIPILYTKRPPVLSTIIDIIRLKQKASKLHKQKGFDFTHCRSYIAALVGQTLKRKFGLPFIFDMRGFWADERVDGKIWNISKFPFNIIYKYFKQKEIEFLKEAKHVVSLTYAGKKEMESWAESKSFAPISVIPCCADLAHFDFNRFSEIDRQKQRDGLGVDNDTFLLGYLGSIGTWYMLPEMMQAFKSIRDKRKAKFAFITKDSRDYILKEAKEVGVNEEDILIQSSERADLPRKLTAWDASIFFILPAYSKTASSPTKQAELLGMGIPLICNAGVGDTTEILKKEAAGIVLENLGSFNLETLYREKEHYQSIALKKFSLESGIKEYIKIYI